MDEMEDTLTCSICAEFFIKAVTLNCSHCFCQFCIDRWRKYKSTCPICRDEIVAAIHTTVVDNIIEGFLLRSESEELRQARRELIAQRTIESIIGGSSPINNFDDDSSETNYEFYEDPVEEEEEEEEDLDANLFDNENVADRVHEMYDIPEEDYNDDLDDLWDDIDSHYEEIDNEHFDDAVNENDVDGNGYTELYDPGFDESTNEMDNNDVDADNDVDINAYTEVYDESDVDLNGYTELYDPDSDEYTNEMDNNGVDANNDHDFYYSE